MTTFSRGQIALKKSGLPIAENHTHRHSQPPPDRIYRGCNRRLGRSRPCDRLVACRRPAGEERGELFALALREAVDRLGGRDPAAAQQLVDLHRSVLGHSEQQVGNLGGLHERGRVGQQLVDRATARPEVALELRALPTNGVGAPQGVLALRERSRRRTALRDAFTIVRGSDQPTLAAATRPRPFACIGRPSVAAGRTAPTGRTTGR
jgi:hypothetical protein